MVVRRTKTADEKERARQEQYDRQLAYRLTHGQGGGYTPARPFDFDRLPRLTEPTVPRPAGPGRR